MLQRDPRSGEVIYLSQVTWIRSLFEHKNMIKLVCMPVWVVAGWGEPERAPNKWIVAVR